MRSEACIGLTLVALGLGALASALVILLWPMDDE